MTKIRVIELEYDLIEIHHNPILKNNPYLIRIFSYNNHDPQEVRVDKSKIDNLYKFLKENKFL
jgi:hypothetical protein